MRGNIGPPMRLWRVSLCCSNGAVGGDWGKVCTGWVADVQFCPPEIVQKENRELLSLDGQECCRGNAGRYRCEVHMTCVW